ncbi:hypothetical protein BCR35DRAFT_302688 [Leucosporidium creatinivorum]|uniref:Uncharacterized protein n=1 Tax=Leucosporidium creatinivorum TaxID=106004 RepID=A0A1Y2FRW4_9BASI|nr:hypothetical protein BCR35DRAFT_302688 [Leucosporidium creatinivorum]
MCWSNATLFYGLWVTTASLNFAATAYKATRPTILAIDLIISRRRRGQLEVEGQDEKTTARELPEEVWELVKDHLLGLEVRQVELDTLDRLRCFSCGENNGGSDCCCPECEGAREARWTEWGYPDCESGYCIENAMDSELLWTRTPEQVEAIQALLAHHGLRMPSTEMWHEEPESYYCDFESLSAISLPLRSANSLVFPSARAEGMHNFGPGCSVLSFSLEALLLPADADRRFRRLVSNYRLRVVDRTQDSALAPNDPHLSINSTPKISPSKDEKTVVKTASKKEAEEEKETPKLFAEAEPRWMLWSLCEPCT